MSLRQTHEASDDYAAEHRNQGVAGRIARIVDRLGKRSSLEPHACAELSEYEHDGL